MDGQKIRPIHKTRVILNSSLSQNQVQQLKANQVQWAFWLAKANAFKHSVSNLSYATILKRGKQVVQSRSKTGHINQKVTKNCHNSMIKTPRSENKDKWTYKPKKGHITAVQVSQVKECPIVLSNRFEVLQYEQEQIEVNELTNGTVTPIATVTSSFKGNKNKTGQNRVTVANTGDTYDIHMNNLDNTFTGNKNKTGQILGKLKACDDNSGTNTHTNVQHELNGQQHTNSLLSVNKNGTGSKLGSMLASVHTDQDSAHTFNAPSVKHVNQIVDGHEQLCFRGNKNKTRQTLGIMAPLAENSSFLGSHIALDQLQAVDPIVDHNQHTIVSTAPQKIPEDILKNRFQSLDHKNCIYQNENTFGFVPLNDLMVYTGKEVIWGSIPDIVEAHRKIRNSGLPNFMGLRIPVQSQLKISSWKKYLRQYWDHQLLDLIEYGFPLDFNRTVQLTSTETNHYSALQYPDHVSKYLQEEIQHKAIIGPFQQMPFPCHISPFLTRDKPNSTNRRVILDLSFPLGHSVNEGVPKNKYLGTYFQLSYPSIDDMVSKLKQLGPEALIYKIDISRAFRHIRIDPGDLDLLGLKHDNYYVDVTLPFGFRHGSVFFQRCTDAVRYVMKEHFHCPNLYNYIDDLIYIALPGHIDEAYSALMSLLTELGLDISISKLVPPTTVAICLGIEIDTVNQTLRIPDDKLQEIRQMVHNYSKKTQVTKKQLQSLLGSLLYITKCVKPARYFLNRMLHLLRASHNTAHIVLNQQFHRDLNWFNIFLKQYNGVTFYDNHDIQDTVHLDASLQGLGGVYQNMVYALTIPLGFMQYSIVHLEILNLIVALKLWGHLWRDKVIQIKCDNMAVVEVIRTGRARDQILATCARNIWLLTSMFNIQLVVDHIPGVKNVIADLLSRWQGSSVQHNQLHILVPQHHWMPVHIDFTKLNQHI